MMQHERLSSDSQFHTFSKYGRKAAWSAVGRCAGDSDVSFTTAESRSLSTPLVVITASDLPKEYMSLAGDACSVSSSGAMNPSVPSIASVVRPRVYITVVRSLDSTDISKSANLGRPERSIKMFGGLTSR